MYIYIYIYAYFAHLCTTSYHIYSHTHAKEITKNYHACVKYIYVCTYVHVYLHVYECRYIYSSHPCIVPYSIYSECRRDRTYSITPTLQHTYSIHCNTLQHTSTHCNTLQHIYSITPAQRCTEFLAISNVYCTCRVRAPSLSLAFAEALLLTAQRSSLTSRSRPLRADVSRPHHVRVAPR